jgi:hypothetical protein
VAGVVEVLAVGDVLADRPDVLALGDGVEHLHLVADAFGVLYHHDGVGTLGEVTPRVDADGGPRRRGLPDAQDGRRTVRRAEGVAGADRVAVHRRALVARHRPRRGDRPREGAAVGGGERERGRPLVRGGGREEALAGVVDAGPPFEPGATALLVVVVRCRLVSHGHPSGGEREIVRACRDPWSTAVRSDRRILRR